MWKYLQFEDHNPILGMENDALPRWTPAKAPKYSQTEQNSETIYSHVCLYFLVHNYGAVFQTIKLKFIQPFMGRGTVLAGPLLRPCKVINPELKLK